MTVGVEQQIIRILADGKFHSGEQIAGSLGISRTSVWKKIQSAKDIYDLQINAVSGRGYWLPGGVDLLDATHIQRHLKQDFLPEIRRIHVFDKLDSTNQFLLENRDVQGECFSICLAEMQTQGRGRRGRQWLSPFGKNIHLSLACYLNMPMSQVAGLSIAAGVAVADAVTELGLPDIALKWPNDIHMHGQKLAGLLVEIKGETEGPIKTVIGIGLNVVLPPQLAETIGQPVTDLARYLNDRLPSRNDIAVTLIDHVSRAVSRFAESGLPEFISRWSQYDAYLNKNVMIKSATQQVEGIYRGLDATGALLLETDLGISVFNAGEVSMRQGKKLS